jgi:hypothetical protein
MTTREIGESLPIGSDGEKWPFTFDAQIWAKAFVLCYAEKPTIASDEGTMIGWFANAMMVAYDHAKREVREAVTSAAQRTADAITGKRIVRDDYPDGPDGLAAMQRDITAQVDARYAPASA